MGYVKLEMHRTDGGGGRSLIGRQMKVGEVKGKGTVVVIEMKAKKKKMTIGERMLRHRHTHTHKRGEVRRTFLRRSIWSEEHAECD